MKMLRKTLSPCGGVGARQRSGGGYPTNFAIFAMRQPYPPYLKDFTRAMRKNLTDAERMFWQRLRDRQLGVKFRRQFAIDGRYVADFVCLKQRLIVEIDGGQHDGSQCDADRTLYLQTHNFRVIRFWNHEVLQNIDGCLEVLLKELQDSPPSVDPITDPAL
jgi:very-short-patch-repair endonuclease